MFCPVLLVVDEIGSGLVRILFVVLNQESDFTPDFTQCCESAVMVKVD
jgi:hypothetical protein